MITGEAIQRVQSLYSKGVQSVDSRLTPRHIYSALISARSTLIRQRINKSQAISEWAYQVLPCVELQRAKVYECPCIPANNCFVLRSKHKLPKHIIGIEGSMSIVTSVDGTIRFDMEKFQTTKYMSGNKFTANKPGYYFHNGYLFITVLKFMKAVTVKDLFDDFIEAKNFLSLCGDCTDCQCDDIMDAEFPFDGDQTTALIQLANNELIIIMKQMTEDKTNNSSDDTATTGGMVHQPQGE